MRIIYELFPEDYDVIVWIPRVLLLSLESFQCIDLVPKFLMMLRAPTPSRTVFVFIFLLWVILIAKSLSLLLLLLLLLLFITIITIIIIIIIIIIFIIDISFVKSAAETP